MTKCAREEVLRRGSANALQRFVAQKCTKAMMMATPMPSKMPPNTLQSSLVSDAVPTGSVGSYHTTTV